MTVKTTAELLEDLFRTHRHPSGREYSNQEVSTALNDAVDASYIAKLRRGAIKNPGRNALLALCRFFKVKSDYFFPELQSPYDPNEQNTETTQAVPRSVTGKDLRTRLNELLDEYNIDKLGDNQKSE